VTYRFDIVADSAAVATSSKVITIDVPTPAVTAISADTGTLGDFITADRTLDVTGTLSRGLQTGETLKVFGKDGSGSDIQVLDANVHVTGTDVTVNDPTQHAVGLVTYRFDIVADSAAVATSSKVITIDVPTTTVNMRFNIAWKTYLAVWIPLALAAAVAIGQLLEHRGSRAASALARATGLGCIVLTLLAAVAGGIFTLEHTNRLRDVETIYLGRDAAETARLLATYRVRYDVIGAFEEQSYKGLDRAALRRLGTVVFTQGPLEIVAVAGQGGEGGG